ncbi:hypothetical protein [Nonomuraea endophytica]|uniref:hypothetical protein n=1 Tax=Nonomuraea endophytica TaxID=714136 RepID=UPI0037C7AC98
MSGPDEHNAVVVAELGTIAGREMYQRNAFRVTGLETEADAGVVRGRQQWISAARSAGADADLDADEVRAAFDRIRDAPRRLVHELFWLWDSPKATCSCARSLHKDHDVAVRAHSAALDREARLTEPDGAGRRELADLWNTAARAWSSVLGRADLWDHVRHRVHELDSLDASAVEPLRSELPAFLVKPLVELAGSAEDPARLATIARSWPVPSHVLDDALKSVSEPLFETVRSQLDRPGDPAAKVAGVRDTVLPLLRRLDGLFPRGQNRRAAGAHAEAANMINDCARELVSESALLDDAAAREWLNLALSIADDDTTRRLITKSLADLDKLVETLDSVAEDARRQLAAGRTDAVRDVLRQLLAQAGGGAGSGALAGMLAQVENQRPLVWRTDPRTPPLSARALRSGVIGTFAVAVVLAIGWMYGVGPTPAPVRLSTPNTATMPPSIQTTPAGPEPAMLFAERMSDNATAGTCLATEEGWDDSDDKSSVPTVSCDEPHWAEVLGYVRLARAPSRYPGDDQVIALARFHCGRMLEHQKLSKSHDFDYIIPDRASWNEGGEVYQNYATCVAVSTDYSPMAGGRVTESRGPVPGRVTTMMSLYAAEILSNAPVGTCVRTKRSFDSMTSVSVLPCSQPHWGKIIGYPVLYGKGKKWPGLDALVAKVRVACDRLANSRSDVKYGIGYSINYIRPLKRVFADKSRVRYATCVLTRTDDRLMKR